LVPGSSGSFFVLTASDRSAYGVDSKVCRGAIQPSTNVAVDLQTGLTVQAPKSIVRYLFSMREVAQQAHQYCDDSSIVFKKSSSEFSLVPML
jgi:hypothetical protein